MKKITSILLSILICFSSAAVFAADGAKLPEFKTQVEIGRCNWSFERHGGVVTYDREGNPLFCFSGQGGYYYVYDLITGKLKDHNMAINPGYIFNNYSVTAPNGKVYNYPYHGEYFEVYDPLMGTVEREDAFIDGVDLYNYAGMAQNGYAYEDGKIYMGTYKEGGAYLVEYDTNTKTAKSYGAPNPGTDYMKGIAVSDKYIHIGVASGQPDDTKCVRIDKKTGEKIDYNVKPGGGSLYHLNISPDGIVGANDFGKINFFDEETLEKLWTVPLSPLSAGVKGFSPDEKGICYVTRGKDNYTTDSIWRCDIYKQEMTKVLDMEEVRIESWAQLPDRSWVIAIYQGLDKFGWFNPKTGEAKVFPHELPDTGPQIQSFEISEDNIVYSGGYQTSFGAYNIDDGEYIFSIPEWEQNEGEGFLNGKVYVGVYTDAYLCRYDPDKPMNFKKYSFDGNYQGHDVNPSMVFDIQYDQDRPFVVEGYKDKLYVGSAPGYNKVGGALTIYEEDEEGNPFAKVYKDIIPGQTIDGIAVKDSLVYLSGSTWVGLGGTKTETQAKMAVFDSNTEQYVVEPFVPELPAEVGNDVEGIGELSFGPDGLLWGAASKSGLVFAMDPQTFEVKKYALLTPGDNNGSMTRPNYIRWGDDGLLYTCAGWTISVLDPETMNSKGIMHNCSLFTLDVDGNVWYAKGGGMCIMEINQFDRLTRFLKICEKLSSADYTAEEWEMLQAELEAAKSFTKETDNKTIAMAIRRIKAIRDKKDLTPEENAVDVIIEGEKFELNEETGVSRLYNGRTIIPYRPLLEKLGYKVEFDVIMGTITAKNEEHEINMIMGDNTYVIDGEEFEFDTPPVLLRYKKYIPLRVISEGLGYEVTYDDETKTVTVKK